MSRATRPALGIGSRLVRFGSALAATLLMVTFLAVATAHAGLGVGAAVNFPVQVTVGDAGLPASIQLQNNNTLPDTSGTVCNFGDAFPCPAGDPGITLIPSCGQIGAFSACVPAGADPGVFQVSTSGLGATGTACAGVTFSIDLIDPVFGQLRFTPQPPGTHVVLPTSGSICRVDFSVDVLRTPTVDQNQGAPGPQTVQVVDFSESNLVSLSASARGTSIGSTVDLATPTIDTVASPNIAIGGALTDQATVSGRVNPLAGATVDFRLFGPNDVTCAGAPIFESLGVAYPQAGGPVSSNPFTPTTAGTYRWIATYNGDANNAAVTGTCNANGETVTVSSPQVPVTPVEPSPPVIVPGPTLPVSGSDHDGLIGIASALTAAGATIVWSVRRGRSRASPAEHRHMQPAVGRERFTGPPSPAFAQAKTGDTRHQVELARPRVPTHDRTHGHSRCRQRHVALVEDLPNRIVPTNIEPYPVDGQCLGIDVLVVAQPMKVGRHERLHDEATLGREMGGDVLETPDLIVLRQQVEQGVEHQVHQRIHAGHTDIGEVTDRHGQLVASRLRSQPVDHRLRQVDAVDAHPACCQRQGNPTSADRELQRRPAAGPRREKPDGGVLVTAQFVVIGGRSGTVEAHHRFVVLHGADPSRYRPPRAIELHRNYDRPA